MSQSRFEPGCTIFSACEIRVALLPVGDVPDQVWDKYVDLLMKRSKMELSVVSSFYLEKQKSPFTQLRWGTGSMYFKYIKGPAGELPAPASHRACLSASHKVLGVIGICHCPSHEQIRQAYSEFEQMCRQFPDAFTVRCFAFEPSDQPAEQEDKSAAYLIMFPPDDEEKLEYHVDVMMSDFAACLLMELEKWMLNASPAMVGMNTWLDAPEFSVPVSALEEVQKRLTSDEETSKKRRHGRLRKAMGDHCLLAGSPGNAMEHYGTAIDLSRTVNDFVWLGAALEGLACAKLLHAAAEAAASEATGAQQRPADPAAGTARTETAAGGAQPAGTTPRQRSPSGDGRAGEKRFQVVNEPSMMGEISELISEAQAAYRKPRTFFLLSELVLKHARILAEADPVRRRLDVMDLVNEAIDGARLLSSAEDQLAATMEAADVCRAVRAGRKRALLLQRAIELSRSTEWRNKQALHVVREALRPILSGACARIGSASLADAAARAGSDAADACEHRTSTIKAGAGWAVVQCGLLEALLAASTRTGAHHEVWRAASILLSQHASRVPEGRQKWLLDTLQVASKYVAGGIVQGPGPPPLLRLACLVSPPPWLRPVNAVTDRHRKSKGPFLFHPFEAQAPPTDSSVRWVSRERCEVHVEVRNPCALHLNIDRMSLAGYYTDEVSGDAPAAAWHSSPSWKGTAVTVKLPPYTPPSKLALTGVAKRPGRLVVTGCLVQMFGVTWHQPWADQACNGPIEHGGPEHVNHKTAPRSVEILPPMQLLHGELKGDRLEINHDVQGDVVGVNHPQPKEGSSDGWSRAGSSDFPTHDTGRGQPKNMRAVVFEGEVAEWELRLENIGCQDIVEMSAHVDVVPQARGPSCHRHRRAAPLQPPLGVTVDRNAFAHSLPLKPGESREAKVLVEIGRQGNAIGQSAQVKLGVDYIGDGGGSVGCADGAESRKHARRLEIVVEVEIQRMLSIDGCSFFPHASLVQAVSREPCEGATNCLVQCGMEVKVTNHSSKPCSARIGQWRALAEDRLRTRDSRNSVLAPRERAVLMALIETSGDAAQNVVASDVIEHRWGLHWEQETAAGASADESAGILSGFIALRPEQISSALLPEASMAMQHPDLEICYQCQQPSEPSDGAVAIRVLEDILQESNISAPAQLRTTSVLGWAFRTGSVLRLSMVACNRSADVIHLRTDLSCERVYCLEHCSPEQEASSPQGRLQIPASKQAPQACGDWVATPRMVGTTGGLDLSIGPHSFVAHSFGICFSAPGLYQLGNAPLISRLLSSSDDGVAEGQTLRPGGDAVIHDHKPYILVTS